jgi:hypothetical protein
MLPRESGAESGPLRGLMLQASLSLAVLLLRFNRIIKFVVEHADKL